MKEDMKLILFVATLFGVLGSEVLVMAWLLLFILRNF